MLALAQPLNLANLNQHMVYVQGGTFEMGGESWNNNAKPVHPVQLSDFELCRYPVSQQLWQEVMGDNPEELKFENRHRPVEPVSWNDITQHFLPRLREKTGDNTYCLPTEAQWEYAARGGKYAVGTTFAGSNHLKEVAWYDGNAFSETQVIGQKRPNTLGLYDMSGNVFEWCQDRYEGNYYQTLVDQYGSSPAPHPEGPEEGTERVVRGGSWFYDVNFARVSDRFFGNPPYRSSYIGFRLCRYLPRRGLP